MSMEWLDGSRFHFDVDGGMLEGLCIGPPPNEANTFILLHEGLGCIDLWRDFPQKLAQLTGWGVFVYSRLGYGRSDPVSLPRPLTYMNEEATASLPKILDTIGFKKGILLGHSDGASIGAIYAGATHDPRLTGLIVMAPHFFAEPVSITSIAEAKISFELDGLKAKLSKYHEDVVGAFCGWNDAWLDPEFMNWNIESFLGDIQVPVLALQGAQDQYGTMKQMDALRRGVKAPLDICMLADCQHSPHLEKPEQVLEAIQGLLRC